MGKMIELTASELSRSVISLDPEAQAGALRWVFSRVRGKYQ